MDKVRQKRWYHTTTIKNWKKIVLSGGLFSSTYLATSKNDIEDAFNWSIGNKKGKVLLSVRYKPNNRDHFGFRELVAQRSIPLKTSEY